MSHKCRMCNKLFTRTKNRYGSVYVNCLSCNSRRKKMPSKLTTILEKYRDRPVSPLDVSEAWILNRRMDCPGHEYLNFKTKDRTPEHRQCIHCLTFERGLDERQ